MFRIILSVSVYYLVSTSQQNKRTLFYLVLREHGPSRPRVLMFSPLHYNDKQQHGSFRYLLFYNKSIDIHV